MTQINNGGPAFPHQKEDGSPYWGMTLRDWFAGQALAGLLANEKFVVRCSSADIAKAAIKMADAMLAERVKP